MELLPHLQNTTCAGCCHKNGEGKHRRFNVFWVFPPFKGSILGVLQLGDTFWRVKNTNFASFPPPQENCENEQKERWNVTRSSKTRTPNSKGKFLNFCVGVHKGTQAQVWVVLPDVNSVRPLCVTISNISQIQRYNKTSLADGSTHAHVCTQYRDVHSGCRHMCKHPHFDAMLTHVYTRFCTYFFTRTPTNKCTMHCRTQDLFQPNVAASTRHHSAPGLVVQKGVCGLVVKPDTEVRHQLVIQLACNFLQRGGGGGHEPRAGTTHSPSFLHPLCQHPQIRCISLSNASDPPSHTLSPSPPHILGRNTKSKRGWGIWGMESGLKREE